MSGERRKRRRFQAPFRWMDHCIFWRLGFRQFSFYLVARVAQRIAPYAWTRPLVGCHAAFPLTFRRQVRHQTQEYPPNSSLLSRGYGEAPRGAPCCFPRQSFRITSKPLDPKTPPPFSARYAGDTAVRLVAHSWPPDLPGRTRPGMTHAMVPPQPLPGPGAPPAAGPGGPGSSHRRRPGRLDGRGRARQHLTGAGRPRR